MYLCLSLQKNTLKSAFQPTLVILELKLCQGTSLWNFGVSHENQRMGKDNILNGFEKSGLWSINRDVILDHPALANKKVSDIDLQPLHHILHDQLHMKEEDIEEFDLDEEDGMTREDLRNRNREFEIELQEVK